MKGYNGVAIISRVPFSKVESHHRVMREDCRHVRAWLDVGGNDPIALDNLYIPAGGDIPDPLANVKFAHKLDFYREITTWFADGAPKKAARKGKRAIAVGDLNVAPLEHDVWSHKQLLDVVSHTPIEVELFGHMLKAREWIDVPRLFTPAHEKLYSWWSYRNQDWRNDRGAARSHPATPALRGASATAFSGTCDWGRPDHFPVIGTFNLALSS